MIEKEVSIMSDEVTLAGTFCAPDESGPYPTVLWIHGSGPLDRNDNIPGQELNNSKTIAHFLAEHGIASLRYDKRGVGSSTGEFLSAGHSDLVEDSCSCLSFLSNFPLCNGKQIFVAGHSEGTLIASQLSARFENLAGIILLCPFIENPETLLRRQAKEVKRMVQEISFFSKPILKLYFTVFDSVKGQEKAFAKIKKSKKKVGRLGLSKQPFHWFREFLQLDLTSIHQQTRCPTLAIAGSKDFQCLPSDVHRISDIVNVPFEAHVIEGMSHLLRNEAEDASIFNYSKQLKDDIEPEVLELVLLWIRQQLSLTK